MKDGKTILKKDINPLVQGGAVIGLLLASQLVVFIMKQSGSNVSETLSWEISLTLLLFFALANAVFFLNAEKKGQYWSYSISAFVVFATLSVVISTWLSGFGINDSSSIKWMYFIFSFSYLIFISIIGLMRRIVEIAIKQDKRLRGEQ